MKLTISIRSGNYPYATDTSMDVDIPDDVVAHEAFGLIAAAAITRATTVLLLGVADLRDTRKDDHIGPFHLTPREGCPGCEAAAAKAAREAPTEAAILAVAAATPPEQSDGD